MITCLLETLYLTSELRSKLKAPLGTLISGEPNKAAERLMDIINCEKPKKIFAVGDTVTSTMVKHGVYASVYVVDNRIMRKRIKPVSVRGANEIHIKNPRGTITSEAWKAVEEAAKASSTTKIVVDGEEDLLALPAVIFAPEGSFVLYGQPLEGIVLVRVTQEKKEEIRELIKAMSSHNDEGRING